jgi:hypothetical protein
MYSIHNSIAMISLKTLHPDEIRTRVFWLWGWCNVLAAPGQDFFFCKKTISCSKIYNITFGSGANPSIASYNASVVKMSNVTSTYPMYLVRFKKKNSFFTMKERSTLLQRQRCSCKFKSRSIGPRNQSKWLRNLHLCTTPAL